MSDEPKLRALPQVRRDMMLERFAGIAMGQLITVDKVAKTVSLDSKMAWDMAHDMVAEYERRAAEKQ